MMKQGNKIFGFLLAVSLAEVTVDKTEIKCCLLSIDSLAVVESTAFHTRFNIHDLSTLFAKKKKKKLVPTVRSGSVWQLVIRELTKTSFSRFPPVSFFATKRENISVLFDFPVLIIFLQLCEETRVTHQVALI